MRMRRWIFVTMVAAITSAPPLAFAQSSGDSPSATPTGDQPQKPVAAVGEEGKKPTRGFVSALAHNLKDDLAHMPRWNTVYWLGGGGAAALAVHQEDSEINARLVNKTTDGLW